ncbi:hypothetical protein Q3G72_008191 [Acer saccharum]|nr:hypothetical protein Q3G72_008191 [Acer saccharum]
MPCIRKAIDVIIPLLTLNYFGGNLDNSGECPNEENDDCPYESNDDEENEDENSQDNREVVPPISSGPVLQMSQELSKVQVPVSPSS